MVVTPERSSSSQRHEHARPARHRPLTPGRDFGAIFVVVTDAMKPLLLTALFSLVTASAIAYLELRYKMRPARLDRHDTNGPESRATPGSA